MAKVYLAAPFIQKDNMPEIAQELEVRGHEVTHAWWKVDETHINNVKKMECAKADMFGVMNADVVVLINSKKSEGKAVEQGIAIGLGIPIIAVGNRGQHSGNIFHFL